MVTKFQGWLLLSQMGPLLKVIGAAFVYSEVQSARLPSRGEADRLPQPGVYALLAGFDRR